MTPQPLHCYCTFTSHTGSTNPWVNLSGSPMQHLKWSLLLSSIQLYHYKLDTTLQHTTIWKKQSSLTCCIMICVHILCDVITNMYVCVLFQLSVLTGVRYLQTSLENVLRQGDLNSESDGWLLENSFMETARTNLNIIKSLGKSNQIDTANNGDPNINVPSTSKAHYGPDNVPPKETPEASWPFSGRSEQHASRPKERPFSCYIKRVFHIIFKHTTQELQLRNTCTKGVWCVETKIHCVKYHTIYNPFPT